ncbi:MAG: hypothetical protein WEB88_05245 [Gemmatimonadota bacterium]
MPQYWFTLSVVILTAACGAGDHAPDTSYGVTTRDSAGITIVTSSRAATESPLAWRVPSEPRVTLGADPTDPAGQFHRIRGAAVLADGTLAVLDGATLELRLFNPDGTHRRTVGGAGDGPGEFRQPHLVPGRGSDAVVIYDRQRARLTAVAADGQVMAVRTVDLPPRERNAELLGLLPDGKLVFRRTVGYVGLPVGVWEAESVAFVLVDSAGRAHTVASPVGRRMYYTEHDELGQQGMLDVPFDIEPAAAASARGLFLTMDERADVHAYDATGTLRRILRLSIPPRVRTPELVAEYYRLYTPKGITPWYREQQSRIPAPEVLPLIDRLVVDDLGLLWARRYDVDPADQGLWFVFDPEGACQGTVRLPAHLEVEQIGADFVLGIRRDAFDVEQVDLYDLQREPAI